jgi:hypothetical protein
MPGPIPLAQEELAEVSNYHWMENKWRNCHDCGPTSFQEVHGSARVDSWALWCHLHQLAPSCWQCMSASEGSANEKQLTSSSSGSLLSSSSVSQSCCHLNLSMVSWLVGLRILTLRQHSCFTIFKSMRILIFFGSATAMSWYISNQSFVESTSTAFDVLLMVEW